MSSNNKALRRLLMSLFGQRDLHGFMEESAGDLGDPELAGALPAPTDSFRVYAHEVVSALGRRGLLKPELFELLVEEFPEREADIREVRAGASARASITSERT